MKQLLVFLAVGTLCLTAQSQNPFKDGRQAFLHPSHAMRSAGSFTYAFGVSSLPYTDLTDATSINNGDLWDDPAYVVPVDFPFYVNGTEVTTLTFAGLGATLSSDVDVFGNVEAILAFEADLIDRGALLGISSESPLSYKVEGDVGSRIMKIEWKNAGSYDEIYYAGSNDMFINLQLWLYEGTDNIEVHFGPSSIPDPDLFYTGETGALVGIATFNEDDLSLTNQHFLTGPADMPELTMFIGDTIPVFVDGTPSENLVYSFALSTVLEVLVEGMDGLCGAPEGTATAIASGGEEPYSYLWNTGDTTAMITGLASGPYTVTVTDNAGATASSGVEIYNGEVVFIEVGSTDETGPDLNDGTAYAIPLSGQFPFTYLWSNGATTAEIEGLEPGLYTVTVTDDTGCTASESVIVNPFEDCPELNIIFDFLGFNCPGECNAGIEILDVEGAVDPVTYEWSTGSTDPLITGLCAGVYTLVVTDADGCVATAAFSISDLPMISPNAGSTDETAEDANDGTAWAAPSGGDEPYAYTWSNGATDSLITDLAPGWYTVTVTDANGCTAEQSVYVNPFGCDLLVEEIFEPTCNNACVGSISLIVVTSAPPVTYLWSTGDTTSAIVDLCPGIYSVTVSDTAGCVYTSTYFLFESDPLTVTVGNTNETSQGADDGTAWAIPGGGVPPYTYEWSNGSTDSLVTGLEPGIYQVTVEDAIGCSVSAEVFIFPYICVGFFVTTSQPISCFGGCDGEVSVVPVGGVGPFTFEWSTGDTTQLISGLCAGTYGVTITDEGQGCSGFTEFELGEPDLLDFNVDEVVHVTDTTSGAISVSPFGGTPPYSYQWIGPGGFLSSEEDIFDLEGGFYSLQITDANGCQVILDSLEILDFTVGVKDLPALNVIVYPNPASTQIHLSLDTGNGFEVRLLDATGRIHFAEKNSRVVHVGHLPSGVYFLSVTSDEGYYSGRVTVLH